MSGPRLPACLLALAFAGSAGAEAPLYRLGDLRPGIDSTVSSGPSPICSLGDRGLFSATIRGFTESPLFVSDGTAAGTRRATSSPPREQGAMQNSVGAPGGCAVVGGTAYYVGSDLLRPSSEGLSSLTLFRSDGTPAGSAAIVGSPGGRPENPGIIATAGSRVVFTAYGGGVPFRGIWSTDGGDAGTVRLSPAGFDGFGAAASGVHVAYFVATPSGGTPKLWMTDGVPGGTLISIDPPGGYPQGLSRLTAIGDVLYFAHGSELMRSDGTTTQSLGPISFQTIGPLPVIGTRFAFLRAAGQGIEFWVHDTATGSSQLVFARPSTGSNINVAVAGGRWLFQNYEGGTFNLWWSDGTAAGTARLPDFVALDGVSPAPQSPIAPFLFSRDGRLWRSDGTAAGTRVVPGTDGLGGLVLNPQGAFLTGGRLLAFQNDAVHGVEPWLVDPVSGTAALLVDLHTQPFGSVYSGEHGLNAGSSALFEVSLPAGEVWRTDATPQGTESLGQSSPSSPIGFSAFGEARNDGVALFADSTSSSLARIWLTDGTVAGTAQIKTISGSFSVVRQMQQVGTGWLFLTGSFASPKLWRSDGTGDGTVETSLVPVPLRLGVAPFRDVAAGNALLYAGEVAGDGAGVELWRTDGTQAGTSRVADLLPGANGSGPRNFVPDTGEFHALFTAGPGDQAPELWGTDGTAAHTRRLATFPSTVNGQQAELLSYGRLGSGLVVALLGNAYGLQLWQVSGSSAGFVASWGTPQVGTDPRLVVAGQLGYFGAWDYQHGEELWVTNGFSASLLLDAAPGPMTGFPTYNQPLLEAAGDRIVFAPTDGKGSEPWVSNGTPGGTRRLMDLNPGYPSSKPGLIARLPDRWVLVANDGATGDEPWALRLSALTEPAPVRGDLSGNGQVEPADGALYPGVFGRSVGDRDFLPAADLDGDGTLSSADLQLWIAEFGPVPVPVFPLLTPSTRGVL